MISGSQCSAGAGCSFPTARTCSSPATTPRASTGTGTRRVRVGRRPLGAGEQHRARARRARTSITRHAVRRGRFRELRDTDRGSPPPSRGDPQRLPLARPRARSGVALRSVGALRRVPARSLGRRHEPGAAPGPRRGESDARPRHAVQPRGPAPRRPAVSARCRRAGGDDVAHRGRRRPARRPRRSRPRGGGDALLVGLRLRRVPRPARLAEQGGAAAKATRR